jgi:hypothetical protein
MAKKTESLATQLRVPIILAVVGFLYTTVDDKRKDQLAYTRDQIVNLYGPLDTLAEARNAVWTNLQDVHAPSSQDADQLKIWQEKYQKIVMPMDN